MKTLKVFKYVGFALLGVGFVIVVIFAVQALWNWLIPGLFNGPVITFWQTAGLFILSKILLTGIAPGPQHRHSRESWYWRKKCRDRYMQAAAAEQEALSPENNA